MPTGSTSGLVHSACHLPAAWPWSVPSMPMRTRPVTSEPVQDTWRSQAATGAIDPSPPSTSPISGPGRGLGRTLLQAVDNEPIPPGADRVGVFPGPVIQPTAGAGAQVAATHPILQQRWCLGKIAQL